MAQFRVGQRVRIVSAAHKLAEYCIGSEGVIRFVSPVWVSRLGRGYGVSVVGHPNPYNTVNDCCWGFFEANLAHLTDPKADEFIESLKKLAREPLVLTPEGTLQIAEGK